jgi:hypothetical protein
MIDQLRLKEFLKMSVTYKKRKEKKRKKEWGVFVCYFLIFYS